jgi:hypothetical protein
MNFNIKEIAKDLGFGIAAVAVVVGTMFTIISLLEMINMTEDNIRLAIAIPFVIYFCWMFGSLTRSIYFKD